MNTRRPSASVNVYLNQNKSTTGEKFLTNHNDTEFTCKFCPGRKFTTSISFLSHLASNHASAEGGSYTCRYGENEICNTCPDVGISQTDYKDHVTRHHINCQDRMEGRQQNNWIAESWHVLSSTVNLPAVLNDPGKGKQRDFFTRSWGADFVDSSILPSSPHLCELPPAAFDRYLRKVRKYYSRNVAAIKSQNRSISSPTSSRETTPSPISSPSPSGNSLSPPREIKQQPPSLHKQNIPSIFLDDKFDLTNPATFNSVFPFLNESLNQNSRANPFTLESYEAHQVESSGKLVQERLQHYIDQVEVCIAGQVASKSHHFFQVMTYHDALMSQLLALITVVRTLRHRLADVEGGIVQALNVTQKALRQHNMNEVLSILGTIETLYKTQPTIEILLSRQEFSGALDLISTSQEILINEVVNIESLKYLPNQLNELMEIISKMLLTDFKEIVRKELEREVPKVYFSDGDTDIVSDSEVDEGALSSIVTALVRQRSFYFLEFLEEQAVTAVKTVIKETVLLVLDPAEDSTLTSLVADFAQVATPDGWCDLLQLLVGSLMLLLARVKTLQQVIDQGLSQAGYNREVDGDETVTRDDVDIIDVIRVKATAGEVFINICDQVHERLGKLVTVRSRPQAIKIVSPEELAKVQDLITRLSGVTANMCGKPSAGLQLSHQGQTILYIQHFHEACRSKVLSCLEVEKWRRTSCSKSSLVDLHQCIIEKLSEINLVNGKYCDKEEEESKVDEILVEGDKFALIDSIVIFLGVVSDFCKVADKLPLACVEVAMKTSELFKLFNSRTCQLVLGAGAVNVAGLKTITIRNLAITFRSLSLVSRVVPWVKQYLLSVYPGGLGEKQEITVTRNFDNAAKDYSEHLGELNRKIMQIVDAALNQQLSNWDIKPPVPSSSFKAIGKQLNKLLEAVQDILPTEDVYKMFHAIHIQFLTRVGNRLKEARLVPDNSPTHGLVLSELIFYRENLKYMKVLTDEDLTDSALKVVWNR